MLTILVYQVVSFFILLQQKGNCECSKSGNINIMGVRDVSLLGDTSRRKQKAKKKKRHLSFDAVLSPCGLRHQHRDSLQGQSCSLGNTTSSCWLCSSC